MQQFTVERYDFPAKRTGLIVGKYHGSRAVGYSPVISTRNVGPHRHELALRVARKQILQRLLGRSLGGDLQHKAIKPLLPDRLG